MARQIVELLPEEIIVEDTVSARPWSALSNGEEVETINRLAASIEKESQIQPVLVRSNDNGTAFKIVAGRRRVEAVRLINASKTKHDEPLRVLCMVEEVDDKRAVRQYLMENLHRKDMSPMDLALTIQHLKDDGLKARQIAEYLQVSPTTVSQHLRLLELPPEIQNKVHNREMSTGSAFDVLEMPEVEREQVLDEARQIQGDDEPIKRKNVRKAARDRGATKRRNRTEIVEFFESLNGLDYGEDGDISARREFLTYFGEWAEGKGTDRTLIIKFDKMVAQPAKNSKKKTSKKKTSRKKYTGDWE